MSCRTVQDTISSECVDALKNIHQMVGVSYRVHPAGFRDELTVVRINTPADVYLFFLLSATRQKTVQVDDPFGFSSAVWGKNRKRV